MRDVIIFSRINTKAALLQGRGRTPWMPSNVYCRGGDPSPVFQGLAVTVPQGRVAAPERCSGDPPPEAQTLAAKGSTANMM